LNQSKIINVIDSNSLERDAGGKPGSTFPHPALAPKAIRLKGEYSLARLRFSVDRFCATRRKGIRQNNQI
jgi:hypothetical protein